MKFSEWVEERDELLNEADFTNKLIAKLLWPVEWARTVAVLPTITPAAAISALKDHLWAAASDVVKGKVIEAAKEAGMALPDALLSAAKTIWYANGNIQRIGQPPVEG
jgi:hypothetical protein